MIFVTIGSELPFDRLIRLVDDWAGENNRQDVFAQIGNGTFRPSHIDYRRFLEPPDFRKYFAEASIVVAHAGMGTVLTALQVGKPLLVIPRRAHLGEVRNDHQLATAEHLRKMGRIAVAYDDDELRAALGRMETFSASEKISPYASNELVGTVRAFIDTVAEQRLARRSLRGLFSLRPVTRA